MRLLIRSLWVLVVACSVSCAEKGTGRARDNEATDLPAEIRLGRIDVKSSDVVKATVRVGAKVYCRVEVPGEALGNSKGLGYELEGARIQVNGKHVETKVYGHPRELPYYLFQPTQEGIYEITITAYGLEYFGEGPGGDSGRPATFPPVTYVVTVK